MTFVIIMGSFDFSVISVLKLAVLRYVLYIDRLGLLVIPLALLISVGIGFINGLFVAKFNVPSFMATLGVSIVVEGIALVGVVIITWSQAGMLMLAIGYDIQMILFGLIALGMSIATIDRRRIKIIK